MGRTVSRTAPGKAAVTALAQMYCLAKKGVHMQALGAPSLDPPLHVTLKNQPLANLRHFSGQVS